ncbi:hypothetical protein LHYA1_G002928 [Lachnellula hyalina]|uniref:Protein HRI1 n=1 Tax=Lachnellula hyalina TaxID=1316788 RepID=A0A8H8U2R3_9HELO|nr:uncharacterized protein LHYA1_G002928 [Lachnellula hyalina]TVY29257.1 hypothetical protein LHYA1_G002928 [Lachnellula hyalina]
MSARASTRISIAWPPAAPSEPTDTLVLGVGGWYVDLRITKSDLSIDWAMAGERLTVPENPGTIRFSHHIDSRGFYGIDKGDFSTLPNGDDLEVGTMPAPHLDGKVAPYEEVWREYAMPASGTTSWILRSSDKKTFVGKIGGYYIALGEREVGGFAALREEIDRDTKSWSVKYKVGPFETLPSMEANQRLFEKEGSWKLGDVMSAGGQKFQVQAIEVHHTQSESKSKI